MRAAPILGLLLVAGLTGVAQAAERRVQFGPPASEVAFRAYGLGMLPIDSSFTRFAGWFSYDPDDRASCRVELQVQVASLVTDDPSLRGTIVGPEFMDAASFPALTYVGHLRDRRAGRQPRNARRHAAVRIVVDMERQRCGGRGKPASRRLGHDGDAGSGRPHGPHTGRRAAGGYFTKCGEVTGLLP